MGSIKLNEILTITSDPVFCQIAGAIKFVVNETFYLF